MMPLTFANVGEENMMIDCQVKCNKNTKKTF